MYQIFNSVTGEAMPVLSETPYELAGPLGERREVQKTDESGNLIYLNVLSDEETTEPTRIYQYEVWSEESGGFEWEDDTAPNQPVMIDGGPLYEWRPVVPTEADLLADAKRAKLAEIRALIAATHYKCLKFVDGALTEAEYAETMAYRESLRDAYNAVEAASSISEVESVTIPTL